MIGVNLSILQIHFFLLPFKQLIKHKYKINQSAELKNEL